MKRNKTRKKYITELDMSEKSIKRKDRIVNSIVFAVVSFIAVFMISQIVQAFQLRYYAPRKLRYTRLMLLG